MGKPAFRLSAKDKSTGEFTDIGAAFSTDYEGLFNFVLESGTRIKITQRYDKATKSKVPCNVVVDGEKFFLNLKATGEGAGPSAPRERKSFKVDPRNDEPPF